MNHMNKLLQTIKDNEERFEDTDFTIGTTLKLHLTQSRIRELEALVEEIEKKNQKGTGSINIDGREISMKLHTDIQVGYNQALTDITKVLKDTIKEL